MFTASFYKSRKGIPITIFRSLFLWEGHSRKPFCLFYPKIETDCYGKERFSIPFLDKSGRN